MCDKTMTFSVTEEREVQMKQTLTTNEIGRAHV